MTREEMKQRIQVNEYNCILLKDSKVTMTSLEKGVAPLYHYIIGNAEMPKGDLEVGDKIIGRAVAYLAIYIGVSYIYTKIISHTALEVLEQYDVQVEYDEVVPYIFNRLRDGQCPMETALEQVSDTQSAFQIIDEVMKRRK